ncbi:MAG TPA: TonB-dependent hemoglobin/transferrin/lactoferrin family receptor, partial [Gammaproteobacteria bacterium]|nr:TonB-dependent hemoglobin/transferrin/lactoferrin family receptor [Gammaproteobacteria bacterium]
MKFRAASTLIIGLSLIAPLANSGEIEEIITVVGSRTERSLDQVAATVSVIDAAQIEEEMARDIADLIRFEPGVAVSGTGSRFGLGGFNIRGIEGNRVLTIVDGIRVADEFSFGPFLSARRDYVDVDSLARAEIARGPISSLYGSDALGGVVAFTTKSPRDYLKDNNTHIGVKAGYSSVDSSTVGTFTAAAGNNRT